MTASPDTWYCDVDGQRLSRTDVILDGDHVIHVLERDKSVSGHCTNQDLATFSATRVNGLWRLSGDAIYTQGSVGGIPMGPQT